MDQHGQTAHRSEAPPEREPARSAPRAPAWAPPALWIAGAGYSLWVLAFPLPVRVGVVDGFASELPASDQPYHEFFAAGDLVAGALVLAVAVALLPGSDGWLPRLVWAAFAVFGLATVLDVVFPLDCAPSVSEACRVAEDTGRVSGAHRIHSVTSVVANVAVVAHMAAAVRLGPDAWPVLGRRAAVLAWTTAGSALTVLALVPGGVWVGIPQRISLVCVAAWLVLLGCSVRVPRERREETR